MEKSVVLDTGEKHSADFIERSEVFGQIYDWSRQLIFMVALSKEHHASEVSLKSEEYGVKPPN